MYPDATVVARIIEAGFRFAVMANFELEKMN
jgi:hypothetical protein